MWFTFSFEKKNGEFSFCNESIEPSDEQIEFSECQQQKHPKQIFTLPIEKEEDEK